MRVVCATVRQHGACGWCLSALALAASCVRPAWVAREGERAALCGRDRSRGCRRGCRTHSQGCHNDECSGGYYVYGPVWRGVGVLGHPLTTMRPIQRAIAIQAPEVFATRIAPAATYGCCWRLAGKLLRAMLAGLSSFVDRSYGQPW